MVAFCERFAGQLGYDQEPMSPPPAEKKPNVIQLGLTKNCSHGACRFCNMYGRRGFAIKSPESFKQHVDEVVGYLVDQPELLDPVNRVFIGAGNALATPTDQLIDATHYALLKLTEAKNGRVPRRVAVYGNTRDILEKGEQGLHALATGGKYLKDYSLEHYRLQGRGLNLIYWGVETGSTRLLEAIGKGCTRKDIEKAAELLKNAKIQTSAMVIPGLGGVAYWEDHVVQTANVLNRIHPHWTTLIGLKINEGSAYDKWMTEQEQKGTNRRLTPAEITEQTAQILEGVCVSRVGIYGDDIHTFGHNPLPMGGLSLNGSWSSGLMAEKMRIQAANAFSTTEFVVPWSPRELLVKFREAY
jgi:hypothetical protein